MAGESADEVARRAREKASRLLKHAEAYEKGAAGERAVRQTLTALPPEWFVLHDLAWPGRMRANVDHVAVGPGGVFVIDTKNWSGTLTVRDGILRQNGYSRATMLDRARSAAQAIAVLVPALPAEAVTPVVCFAGESRVEADLGGVLVCHAETLVDHLSTRPAVLSAEWVQFLRFDLEISTSGALEPRGQRAPLRAQEGVPAQEPRVLPHDAASTGTAPGRHRQVRQGRVPGLLRRLLGP